MPDDHRDDTPSFRTLLDESAKRVRDRVRHHAFPNGHFDARGALRGGRRAALHTLALPLSFHPPMLFKLTLTPLFLALGGEEYMR